MFHSKNKSETEQSAVIAAAMLVEGVAAVVAATYLTRRERTLR